MTLQQKAQALLPLIQAAAEGKVIQGFSVSSGKWFDVEDESFIVHPEDYRIKPVPREFWLLNKDGSNLYWSYNPATYGEGDLSHVREVLP